MSEAVSDIGNNENATTQTRNNAGFTHLHLHTGYSLLDGAVRIKDLVKRAKEMNMSAVAITDHGNMYGAIDFYTQMKKAEIKPIIGCEVYVAEKSRHQRQESRNFHLVLLAENIRGYENLCYLVSMANIEGFYRKPRIDHELLKERHEGLIALTACLSGEIPVAIAQGRMDDARALASEYSEIMGPGNFYLEIQRNGIDRQEIVNEGLVKLSQELNLPLVATNDVHYLNSTDYDNHDTLLCIGRGKLKQDPSRHRYDTDSLFFRSGQDMLDLFPEYPEAVENAYRIAERCNVELELGTPKLPVFQVPEGHDQVSYFKKLVMQGYEERLSKLPYDIDREVYDKRLDYEMGIIIRMDFAGYFLIVQDFINYAKSQGIPVGPGRGSGVGSLVAYSLKITDLDPLFYSLIFERFLNPDRISMPDFDVDFCMNRRDEVIRYVSEKYGKDNVGQIATFGSLKARGVVRDVCRVLDIPIPEADRIAKLVPEGPKVTLESALSDEPRLKELLESTPEYRRMYDTAMQLEGLQRHTGLHAAGIVISEKPLWEMVPVTRGEDALVSQYAKEEVELVGLVKFDFLGLKTLTVIDEAVKLVNRDRKPDEQLVITELTPDDPKVFKLIAAGETNGVFQMESTGFQAMLKSLKPDRFEDLILAVAMYRPGPMDNIPSCVARKHGREQIAYDHPLLEGILNETYGLIVYQEQVMQIAAEMGGMTMAQGDTLRKAMGKKKAKLMDEMLTLFREGARKKDIDEADIEKVCHNMVEFAKYGFNKSHAAAYALISYYTAYMKTYHPIEFIAATLTCDMDKTDTIVKFIQEARAMNIKILPPSVLKSDWVFTVEEGSIRYGLGGVKGVGKAAVDTIRETREEKPYTSIYDFCERVDLSKVNKKVVESLIKAGAFDFAGISRAKNMAVLEKAVENGQARRKERESGQTSLMDLFGGGGGNADSAPAFQEEYPEIDEWMEKELLCYEEKVLSVYLSAHPMDRYMSEVKRYCRTDVAGINGMEDRAEVTVAGVVKGYGERMGRRGRWAFFSLQDSYGYIECRVFNRAYEQCEEQLKKDEPVLVSGAVMMDGEGADAVTMLRVLKVESLLEVMKSKSKRLHMHLPETIDKENLQRLAMVCERHKGDTPVICHLDKEEYEVVITLPNKWRVDPCGEMFDQVELILGRQSVVLE